MAGTDEARPPEGGEVRAPKADVPVCIERILDLHVGQPTEVRIEPDAEQEDYLIEWETTE